MSVSLQRNIDSVFRRTDRTVVTLTDDFDAFYLCAGPHIILRCYEEQSSDPLPWVFPDDDDDFEGFLLPFVEGILSQRNITMPFAFVGSILDEICGASNTC